MRAPTASVSTTSALALLVFLAVPVAGIRARGWKRYLSDSFRPNPLFLPLHLISEFSRTLALSLRLFGNMMSGHLLVALVATESASTWLEERLGATRRLLDSIRREASTQEVLAIASGARRRPQE